MKHSLSVAYLSHGVSVTGGHLHEQFVFSSVCDELQKEGVELSSSSFRTNRFFKGMMAQVKMVWLGIKHSKADLNFVSNWMALYAIAGNLFSKRKVIITWHHHDELDVKTTLTRIYMKILFWLLKHTSSKRYAVLVVSEFWKEYFSSKVSPSVTILYFPNLFDTTYYQSFRQHKTPGQIYLGQYAHKTDQRILELAKILTGKGYYCFFTTLVASQAGTFPDYDILCFDKHEDFLNKLAASEYSIAYTRLKEGWNRGAHESILVNTQVIGVPKGGLGDLLKESDSLMAETVEDFVNLIVNGKHTEVSSSFIRKYHSANKQLYTQAVIRFIDSD